ncbi:hypothetical protein CEUSTIGMA_g13451.t1 [Chlamydomonas eustigma]|uniref:SET domain-containing protein n=1 Tax=Chlamydomonas eustigma TaxID=1157962 RepID=A0A250XSM5_9CHLO|nr:hypothetical protein CEUSTIGMA_g13451.t1 [Chlamydomonas eustigma]|eukprot:GAX86036.1 hypothetical protein CEUSTIGMA_g13451.t1 [Chlamydomonas eustigma]
MTTSTLEVSSDEDFARVRSTLERYRQHVQELITQKQSKPDMVAYKELGPQLTPSPDRHGHLPGIRVGDSFNSRGEMAILGLHRQILRGIFMPPKTLTVGAYAIVLSGVYTDDEDQGDCFWYTGEGGLGNNGQQVKDQEFTNGNLALRRSFEQKTPVRVFRGSKVKGALKYTYEGLYKVMEVKREPSRDGALVCKFRLEGVPGESSASCKVESKRMKSPEKVRILKNKLGRTTETLMDNKLGRTTETLMDNKRKTFSTEESAGSSPRRQWLLESLKGRPGLLIQDISRGVEPRVPVPVFNEVNALVMDPDFEYISDYVWADGLDQDPLLIKVIAEEDYRMRSHTMYSLHEGCGIAFNAWMRQADQRWYQRAQECAHEYEWAASVTAQSPMNLMTPLESYNEEGLLLLTESCGIHECGGVNCTSSTCMRNMQVTQGIKLPLEIFMTKQKGWGVRCAEAVPSGTFVCSYVGELMTEAAASGLEQGADHYLFSLDFFMYLFKELHLRGFDGLESEVPAHRVPPHPALPFPVALMEASYRDSTCYNKNGQSLGDMGLTASTSHVGVLNAFRPLLTVNAEKRGNIARFINHSCNGNLAIQGVFARQARSVVLYYICLFAVRDIPAMTEFTYDYGYQIQGGKGERGMLCNCEEPACRGSLL